MSIIDENGSKSVRMAHLAIVGSHRVNGVSHTHTQIMRQTLFRDFDALWPNRIISLTNGISQRRWLADANPVLTALIGSRLGHNWFGDFDRLIEIEPYAQDEAFREEFASVKQANKARLAHWLRERQNISVDPASLFDMHIKRIHEYKRQLLNILQVIGRYNRIRAGAEEGARTVIFAGKAAPGYVMAKRIIHLINCVADIVNNDPKARDLLKVVFVPNYGVQIAERLVSAGDLSEQISTAGTEASGTGNMKLALNGALSIATQDGANTEIRDAVGEENIWMFGHSFEALQSLRAVGYDPMLVYRSNAEVRQSLDMMRDGYFAPRDRDLFAPVVDSLLKGGDPFMVLADYDAYVQAQASVDQCWRDRGTWTMKAILNVSRMSPFSMDRLVHQYAERVWDAKPASAS
jgi:starch phosphorylase